MTQDSLPSRSDFDPWNGNLDAIYAWKNFGGLTIPEAIQRFQENPLRYQEDFMWMGGRAFSFYFPVIENHLYSAPALVNDDDPWNDHEAGVIASGISMQFEGGTHVQHLSARVLDLAKFVLDNIDCFGGSDRVADAWNGLVNKVKSCQCGF